MTPEALVAVLIAELGPEVVKAIRDVLMARMQKEPYLDVDRPKPLTVDDDMAAIDRRVAREGKDWQIVAAMDAALDAQEQAAEDEG